MAKRTGTMLREYTQEHLIHMRNLGAEVTIFDRKDPAHKYLAADYMVTISWHNGLLMIEATLDNKLTVSAVDHLTKRTFVNCFTVGGYYVVKDTLKAIWDSLQYAIYTGNPDMKAIYTDVAEAAQKSLYT